MSVSGVVVAVVMAPRGPLAVAVLLRPGGLDDEHLVRERGGGAARVGHGCRLQHPLGFPPTTPKCRLKHIKYATYRIFR